MTAPALELTLEDVELAERIDATPDARKIGRWTAGELSGKETASEALYDLAYTLLEHGADEAQALRITEALGGALKARLQRGPGSVNLAKIVHAASLQVRPDGGVSRFVAASAVTAARVDWIWRPYIPLGELVLLDGDPGVGKSTLALRLVRALLRGETLPGQDKPYRLPADSRVMIASAEDDLAKIVRPRLDAMGITATELERVHLASATFDLTQASERDALVSEVVASNARLLIVDPLVAYLGGTDTHIDSRVRVVLKPLSELSQANACTAVAIRHLTKTSRDRALYRGGGSIGFAAAARSVLLAGHDPDNVNACALTHLKNNYGPRGPTVGYVLEAVPLPSLGGDQERSVARFTEVREGLTANRMLAPDPKEEPAGKLEDATTRLHALLVKHGALPAQRVKEWARDEEISPATLRRAAKALRIEPDAARSEDGQRIGAWTWALPDGTSPF